MHLGRIIQRNAELFPDKIAYMSDTQRITFAHFNERVNRLYHALHRRGLRKGDRFAILAYTRPEYMEGFGVAEKSGLIAVPINYRLKGDELAYQFNDSGAKVLLLQSPFFDVVDGIRDRIGVEHYIGIGGCAAGMEPYEDVLAASSPAEPEDVSVSEDDVVYIIYTSGTTGKPNGAMITHRGQRECSRSMAIEVGIRRVEKHLEGMMLFHIGPRSFLFPIFHRGCTNYLVERFDARRFLEIIEAEKITTTELVPTQIAMILDLPDHRKYDTSSLHTIFYAAQAMPVALLKRAIERFGRVFVQGFGQTETGPLITCLAREHHNPYGDEVEVRRLASCGQPAIDVDVRIVDDNGRDLPRGEVGEIVARHAWIMKGYWGKPEKTAETIRDGWVYTGDLGYLAEEGFLYIVDRKKDMIISGGENIYPREIEEVLYSHPAIREAAVIGVPNEQWGEEVKAVVALREGGHASEQELIDFCKERLASFKKPRSVDFLAELPKTGSGKIYKKALREPYWKDLRRKVVAD
ncbi:MAG: long-chain-fatty-acid--CoA ligase [Deltaproteobacteria bacterium]|nr:long-chain-fatty-acid--CoA ligase [Deltaproteobacteria bacterium]